MVKIKLGRALKKGLENIVAPILIGAGALLGSYQEAKAHTNDPSFYIMYAQADQVNFTDSNTLNPANTNIWKQNYTAYAPGYGGYTDNASLNILVGFFIDTVSTAPITVTNKMWGTDYAYILTDISKSSSFTVTRGIVASNGVWQSKPLTDKIVDTSITDLGDGTGVYDNNHILVNSAANSVAGNSLSSAIQISLNNLNRNDTLTFQSYYGDIVFGNSVGGSHVHYTGNDPGNNNIQIDPNPGSITFIPEPSTYILLGGGLAALAWRRRKRNGEKADNDLISAKAQEYAEDIRRRG